METIFISVAAQDDEELKHTIDNAFKNADLPERVFVGVALTAMKSKTLKDLKSRSNKNNNIVFDFIKQKRNNLKTLGIGKGRFRAASLYNNQDYMLQIDCHTFLDISWDTKLISFFKEASEHVEGKIVLSAIPPVYRYCCTEHNFPIKSNPESRYPYYENNSFFVNVVPRWTEANVLNKGLKKFLPVSKVSPAFIFGNKDFANNHGIHKDAIFYDEDFTQSVNLFNKDFAFVFPNIEDFPVMHLDSNGIIKGHDRYFFLNYLNANNNDLIHEKLRAEYINFVKNKENLKALEKYRKYSKVDPIKGFFSFKKEIIPESFRLDER